MSASSKPPIPAIIFYDVSKVYRLYKSDRRRFLGFVFGFLQYNTKPANDRLNFVINQGESVAVLGRNGAGKSTLLKMITGVTFPTSGSVKVNGMVSALLELTAGFEMNFTGRENIYLKASLMGMPKKQVLLLEQQIIDFAELDEYIDQPVRSYSSGMKARLGFAINVHLRPNILLIDEALSVGDARFQEKCRKKVAEVREQRSATLVLVTHNTESAKLFCDRGLVLDRGRLVCDAPIDKACTAYQSL